MNMSVAILRDEVDLLRKEVEGFRKELATLRETVSQLQTMFLGAKSNKKDPEEENKTRTKLTKGEQKDEERKRVHI